MKYQAKILTSEEFDALPYPEMETSLGVADPVRKVAYVRDTGIPALNLFNLAHEIEHLEEGGEGVHADHYRNGVYYKGMKEILTAAGSVIPGPWQPFAMAGGAMQQRQAQKKAAGQQQSMSQGSPMGSFQPQAQEAPQPNVIQPGGGGLGEGAGSFGSGISGIDKIRQSGFFSGRNAAEPGMGF